MARKLYRFTVIRPENKIDTTLGYYHNDEEAVKMAKKWEAAFVENVKVKVELIMQPTRVDETCPIFVGIYETDNVKKRLALTAEQKEAVKAIYDALGKAQNLGVCFVESPNYGIYAFNGNDVEEWDATYITNEENSVPFGSLTYVGPELYEQSACDDDIYIKFKD